MTPIKKLNHPLFKERKLDVYAKLDYLNHPQIQGNKWHKLKGQFLQMQRHGYSEILTFGGAYSNHIAATAAACQAQSIRVTAIIRGDELANHPEKWSHTLHTARQNGMQFEFVSRADYRKRHQDEYLQSLQQRYPNAWIVPEGGSNPAALIGLAKLAKDIEQQLPQWTDLILPVGTGGTLAGLSRALSPINTVGHTRTLHGICALKDVEHQSALIQTLIAQAPHCHYRLCDEFVDKGYGKESNTLKQFRHQFEQQFDLPLDPIYNNKSAYGMMQLIQRNHFAKGATLLWLHTGGLQGCAP